jgi:hypothetical protein
MKHFSNNRHSISHAIANMPNLSLSQSPGRFVVGNLRALKSSRFSFLATASVGAG